MSEKMNPHVSIIILNWNGWKDTIECLESIYQNNYSNYSIVLVDNNSDDESVDKIKGYCKGEIEVNSPFFRYNSKNKPIEILECETVGEIKIETVNPPFHNLFLIKNDINVGFAEGNNIGIRYALNNLNSDYILLLNNDTVVDKEFIVEMLKVSENDNEIGITGPKMYYYDSPNQIWFAGGKISWKFCRGLNIGNHEVDLGQYDNVARVEFISGCAFLIKKEVIDRIGMLDKR
ncbi:MAG: glycosyltransferase family 2 protein, partial [Methanobacterium sp.]